MWSTLKVIVVLKLFSSGSTLEFNGFVPNKYSFILILWFYDKLQPM